MPAIESTAREVHSAAEVVANYKETRARLAGLPAVPQKLPAQIAAPPEPIIPPPVAKPVPIAEIFEIVDAVCTKTGVSREHIFSGVAAPQSIARQIALALVVIRLRVPHDVAAGHFGVLMGTVRAALSKVEPIFFASALPLSGQIDLVVTHVADNWERYAARADHATVGEIKRAVCEEFRLTRVEIEANRRTAAVCGPRQIAMALARRLTPRSLPYIGDHFGGRDHTTVLHAVRVMAPFIEKAAATLSPTATVAEWVIAVRAEWEAPR